MAKGIKGIKKGEAKAAGLVPLDSVERMAKELDNYTLFRIINQNFFATEADLDKIYKDKKKPIIERAIAGHMHKLLQLGSLGALDYFISRICGKIPDQLLVTNNNPYAKLSIDELKKEHAKIALENKKTFELIQVERDLIAAINADYRDVTE